MHPVSTEQALALAPAAMHEAEQHQDGLFWAGIKRAAALEGARADGGSCVQCLLALPWLLARPWPLLPLFALVLFGAKMW